MVAVSRHVPGGPFERFKRTYFRHLGRDVSEEKLQQLYAEMVKRQAVNYRSKAKTLGPGIGPIRGKPFTKAHRVESLRRANPTMTRAEAGRLADTYAAFAGERKGGMYPALNSMQNLVAKRYCDCVANSIRSLGLESKLGIDKRDFAGMAILPPPMKKLIAGFGLLPTQKSGQRYILVVATRHADLGQDFGVNLPFYLFRRLAKLVKDDSQNGRKILLSLQQNESKELAGDMASLYNRIVTKNFTAVFNDYLVSRTFVDLEPFFVQNGSARQYGRFEREKKAVDELVFIPNVEQFQRFNRENSLFSAQSRSFFMKLLKRVIQLAPEIRTPKDFKEYLWKVLKHNYKFDGAEQDFLESLFDTASQANIRYNPEKAFRNWRAENDSKAKKRELAGYFGFLVNMAFFLREEPGLFRYGRQA